VPDYPSEALAAATAALVQYWNGDKLGADEYKGSARAALDAAAPLLADACAKAILQHMEDHGLPMHVDLPADAAVRRNMRRIHFTTAARVAASAFSTDEEMKRQAAEALATGDYIACQIPESGE
jgi:hypothetical protein